MLIYKLNVKINIRIIGGFFMKRYYIILLLVLFSLVSCTKVSRENKVMDVTKANSIFWNAENSYIKKAIERKEEERKQNQIEAWRAEHLISTASTTFDPSQYERTVNIKLAANFINGLVLEQNEEFSFNNIVGQRTTERGFLPADIYINTGKEVITEKSPGGGICQVSSTLCMAVMQTSMQIVERNIHSKAVEYATLEQEAMINWGTSDFRFVNSYPFPIKIEFLFINNQTSENIVCNIFSL